MARTYKTKSGDTFSSIASHFYGDPTLFPYLVAANGIANPNVLPVGKVLSIPDLPQHTEIYREQVDFETQAGNFDAKVARDVPAGWRLVIENVCGHYQAPSTRLGAVMLNVGSPEPPEIRTYPFPWVKVEMKSPSEFQAFNHMVRIYVDGPAELRFDVYGILYDTPGAEAHGSFSVTGHLEALP